MRRSGSDGNLRQTAVGGHVRRNGEVATSKAKHREPDLNDARYGTALQGEALYTVAGPDIQDAGRIAGNDVSSRISAKQGYTGVRARDELRTQIVQRGIAIAIFGNRIAGRILHRYGDRGLIILAYAGNRDAGRRRGEADRCRITRTLTQRLRHDSGRQCGDVLYVEVEGVLNPQGVKDEGCTPAAQARCVAAYHLATIGKQRHVATIRQRIAESIIQQHGNRAG